MTEEWNFTWCHPHSDRPLNCLLSTLNARNNVVIGSEIFEILENMQLRIYYLNFFVSISLGVQNQALKFSI